jgi:hypothetical protein
MFALKPEAIITNFMTQKSILASDLCRMRQLVEHPMEPLLDYDQDPIYIEVEAVLTDFDDQNDILFHDTNMPVSRVIWSDPSGTNFVVAIEHLDLSPIVFN